MVHKMHVRHVACWIVLVLANCAADFTFSAEPQAGKQVEQSLRVKANSSSPQADVDLGYLLFLPAGFSEAKENWPLMLFLHGAGERGNELSLVKRHGPPKIVETKPDFPFVVVSPQCPTQQRWDAFQLMQLVDDVVAKHRLDKRRIYVTGLSMGGFGTWTLVAANPTRFAAAIPICGGGNPPDAEKLKRVPFWVFHGAKDTAVSLARSEEMVKAVEASGGSIKFTVYPDAAHDSWTETYNNPKVYDWLLGHRLASEK